MTGSTRAPSRSPVACAACLLVPLSISSGTHAGHAHLGSVLAAWAYTTRIKVTMWSLLPWAVDFALLPAFLAYGGWGGGLHGAPPTWEITGSAALLGIGIHVLVALPDLVADNHNRVRSLPLPIRPAHRRRRAPLADLRIPRAGHGGARPRGLIVGLRR